MIGEVGLCCLPRQPRVQWLGLGWVRLFFSYCCVDMCMFCNWTSAE